MDIYNTPNTPLRKYNSVFSNVNLQFVLPDHIFLFYYLIFLVCSNILVDSGSYNSPKFSALECKFYFQLENLKEF